MSADFEIIVSTKGVERATSDLKQVSKSIDDNVKSTERLTGEQSRLLRGLNALGREFPLLGAAINAAKNPFTLIAVAGVAAFTAIKAAVAEARREIETWFGLSGRVKVSLDGFADAAESARQLAAALKDIATNSNAATKGLEDQIELLSEQVEAQIKVLEAQKQIEAARIEASTDDPIERARLLKNNDLKFGARVIGLRKSTSTQQAALIEQQITEEKRLQLDAQESVPTVGGLKQHLQGIQADKAALEEARRDNVKKGQRAELLRLVSELGPEENIFTALNSGQLAQLREDGIHFGVDPKEQPQLIARAKELLPGAVALNRLSRDRVAKLQTSLNAGIGALPVGAARSGLLSGEITVEDFVGQAETGASKLMTESAGRVSGLQSRRGRLLRQQSTEEELGKLGLKESELRGDISIRRAVTQEDERQQREQEAILRELGATTKKSDGTILELMHRLLENAKSKSLKVEKLEREVWQLKDRESKL